MLILQFLRPILSSVRDLIILVRMCTVQIDSSVMSLEIFLLETYRVRQQFHVTSYSFDLKKKTLPALSRFFDNFLVIRFVYSIVSLHILLQFLFCKTSFYI